MTFKSDIRGKICFSVFDVNQVPDTFCATLTGLRTANMHLIELAVENGARNIPGVLIETVKEHRLRYSHDDDD